MVDSVVDSVVDSLVSTAVQKLADVLTEQIDLFGSATDELKKLKDTLEYIQAVLADAGRRQINQNTVQLWLSKLKDMALEIDELLDKGISSARGKGKGRSKLCACLLFPIDYAKDAVSRYKVAGQIKDIRERLDQIAEDKNRYFLTTSGK